MTAAECDLLSEPEAVEETALGSNGFLDRLGPNSTWIDCSTANPSFSKRMAVEAQQRKVRFLDAPVSGSAAVAADGKLVFWVGGEESDVEKVRPLLLCLGNRIVHAGPHGAGSAMKLVVNLLLGAGMAAFAEATTLGESLGLQRGAIFDALSGMPKVAPFLFSKCKKIENGNYQAEFPLSWMQTDLHLGSVSAYESGVALPVTNAAKELYRLAMRNWHGDEDFAAIYRYLASNSSEK